MKDDYELIGDENGYFSSYTMPIEKWTKSNIISGINNLIRQGMKIKFNPELLNELEINELIEICLRKVKINQNLWGIDYKTLANITEEEIMTKSKYIAENIKTIKDKFDSRTAEAILALYRHMNGKIDYENLLEDYDNDYLTIMTARNGLDVVDYLDENRHRAIYIDDLMYVELDDQELDEEVF